MISKEEMQMGNILVNNPRSWGCWTPNLEPVSVVLCVDRHNQVLEYPMGAIRSDGMTPWVRVKLTRAHLMVSGLP